MKIKHLFFLLLVLFQLNAEDFVFQDKNVEFVLKKYQNYSYYDHVPKSRFYSFSYAFDYFSSTGGSVIVELGTSRSFVHGGHIGCNSDMPVFLRNQFRSLMKRNNIKTTISIAIDKKGWAL